MSEYKSIAKMTATPGVKTEGTDIANGALRMVYSAPPKFYCTPDAHLPTEWATRFRPLAASTAE